MAEGGDGSLIRPARGGDVAFVTDCTRNAYQKYVERLGRQPQPVIRDYRDAIAEGLVWILEDDGSAAGLLVLTPEPDCLLIYSIAVDPSRQGRGHGQRLMRFAEAEARRQGLSRVRLYTNEHMSENVGFYQSLGYRETHREPFKGTQTLHMRLDLGET